MAYHPLIQHLAKLTPEQIDALATKLAQSDAPLPNLAALNPALQRMQVLNAAKMNPAVQGPPAGSVPQAPTQPLVPPQPVVQPSAPTMAQTGTNLGTVNNNPVRPRNPYANFGGA